VNTCGPTRTVTRILHEAPIRGSAGYYTSAGPKSYQTQGLVGDSRPDFRLVRGCYDKLKNQQSPPLCNDAPCVPLKVRKNLAPVTQFIDALPLYGQMQNPPTSDGYLWQPFLLVYSPNLPHWGPLNLRYFREHFCMEPENCPKSTNKGGRASLAARYLTNVEVLDYGLGALLKHLKRACVCDNGQKKSLYETTIIAFVTDNGWMLPAGKAASNTDDLAGENGFRTPLIVSLPEHRLPVGTPGRIAPEVFTNQLVHATDVTRTLLAYAKNGTSEVRIPWDLKGTDLRNVIDHSSTAPVRDVLVGQWSDGQDVDVFDNRWFLVTRPGLVGVCTNGSGTPGAPLTFCLDAGTDCTVAPYTVCRRQDAGAAKSRICMNRPTLACDTDDDCDDGLCVNSDCRVPKKDGTSSPPDSYGFKDFDLTPCESDTDCRPAGICQPPVLRYAVLGTPPTDANPIITPDVNNGERVYLLTSDPDEKQDLLTIPNDGLDVSGNVRSKLRDCMARWDLWKPGEAATTCSALNLKYGG
jgi:hypothetical protein